MYPLFRERSDFYYSVNYRISRAPGGTSYSVVFGAAFILVTPKKTKICPESAPKIYSRLPAAENTIISCASSASRGDPALIL